MTSFRVRVVENTLDGLVEDLDRAGPTITREMRLCVLRNITEGNKLARDFARARAGKHGTNYYKRISAEMTGEFQGEYGPEGIPKTDFVGVGFRDGVNTDLPDSADIIGPKFAHDAAQLPDAVLW